MRFRLIALTALCGLLMLAPAAVAAAPCCKETEACCTDMEACCQDQGSNLADTILTPALDQRTDVKRQVLVVWFMRPVRIAHFILQGQYIIEHDNDRLANRRPCTHIYSADRPNLPVVQFHCTHLKRARAERNTVFLEPTGDPTVSSKLVAIQFAGETAAHGVPVVR